MQPFRRPESLRLTLPKAKRRFGSQVRIPPKIWTFVWASHHRQSVINLHPSQRPKSLRMTLPKAKRRFVSQVRIPPKIRTFVWALHHRQSVYLSPLWRSAKGCLPPPPPPTHNYWDLSLIARGLRSLMCLWPLFSVLCQDNFLPRALKFRESGNNFLGRKNDA
jgi:hypothetical protein